MSSIFGDKIKVSIFGQSHSPAIGVTVDGLPSGFRVDMEELSRFMARRAPGKNAFSTARKEADLPEFLSGLKDGTTCGAPLTAIIRNTDTRSRDYDELRRVPRPGHADFPAQLKYGGAQDFAGGGHFSGRLTAPLCIAGGICRQILTAEGINIYAHIASIGDIEDKRPITASVKDKSFPVIDDERGEQMQKLILAAREARDSIGGTVECVIIGLPAGIGEPMFDGMENRIAKIIFGIPAVKGLEFGSGFAGSRLRGSENNDPFTVENGRITTETNNHGGILGGISTGMPIVFRVAFKPTPSIAQPQKSVDMETLTQVELEIKGRHDPCIVPRAVPVVEAAAAIAVLDAYIK